MPTEIFMPASGQTSQEATIIRWLKHVGDDVKKGDILLEIETDKAILEIESYADGILLHVHYDEGDIVAAGEVIAQVGRPGEQPVPSGPADQFPDAKSQAEPQASVEKSEWVSANISRGLASPAARCLAKRAGIMIENVTSSRDSHIIKKDDVARYLQQCAGSQANEYSDIPLTSMRKALASRMMASATEIPQFTATVEIDMSACQTLRKKVNAYAGPDGVKISFADLIMKCAARAIEKSPIINAAFYHDAIRVYKHVNFGLAVSLDDGLVVPVVQHADTKSLTAIAQENRQHIDKARNNRLSSEDLEGGTITLSNLGMFGVTCFTALVKPPESCILAAGRIAEKPVSRNGQILSIPMMALTASFDHRVIDGAVGAKFLRELQFLLENPELALAL